MHELVWSFGLVSLVLTFEFNRYNSRNGIDGLLSISAPEFHSYGCARTLRKPVASFTLLTFDPIPEFWIVVFDFDYDFY